MGEVALSFSISAHAVQRWIDRVNRHASTDQARAEIRRHTKAIEAAIAVGCRVVKLPGNQRIVLDPANRRIITITPPRRHLLGLGKTDLRVHNMGKVER